jgi:ERCC4-related helicase
MLACPCLARSQPHLPSPCPSGLLRLLLQDNPDAKVIMLVPEVVLCTQQAAAFIKGGVPGAAAFSGANEALNINNWDLKLNMHSVLVCTPQILVNVLEKKRKLLQQVQLLVLDEVHHTSKEHPYAKVLQQWRALKDSVSCRGLRAVLPAAAHIGQLQWHVLQPAPVAVVAAAAIEVHMLHSLVAE